MKTMVYLDNAATTPVRPEVLEAMMPFLTDRAFGNPSSSHNVGRTARAGVEEARRKIATALGVEPREVIFTSGGTEADNLALAGAAMAAKTAGRPFQIAVGAIDHKAVLGPAQWIEQLGGEMITLPVDPHGRLDAEGVENALERGVAVLGTMWVNNEVGTVQDVAALAERCAAARTPLHIDAVQAIGKIRCGALPDGVTFLSLSAHKIGGPKGTGALIVRNRGTLEGIIHGGGQQSGLRPGTENVPGIAGLGRAVELALAEQEAAAALFQSLRDQLERCLLEQLPDAVVHAAGVPRAPHISNVSIPGTDSESLLMHLDLAGIACSSGSACNTGSVEPSHVLTAMGVPRELGVAALRFSFGKQNTAADVQRVAEELPRIVAKVRRLAGVLGR
ncbi:MAG: cysteine desulfurase [Gemmatimonadetes bacterium]|nr:cysteine desulfurase [Gemmatimonadota bacterium]